MKFNLAPLEARRDMAMLGLIHRTVLGLSPPQFYEWFFLAETTEPAYLTRYQENKHDKQLHDWLKHKDTELLRRIALGLVRVHNKLPQEAVDCISVRAFQTWLHCRVKQEAARGTDNWENCFNLRKKSWRQVNE